MSKKYVRKNGRGAIGPAKITSALSLAGLSGTGLKLVIEGRTNDSDNLEMIRKIEMIILAVASGQYVVSWSMSYNRLQRWRYVDWIITTPLLLRTFHLLAVEKGFDKPFLPAFSWNMLMIWAGYLSEFPNTKRPQTISRHSLYILSTVAMIFIFREVKEWDDYLKSKGVDTGRLPYFFYLGWTAYGLNFLNPDEELRQTTFNILDFVNKGLYSFEIQKVIRENF